MNIRNLSTFLKKIFKRFVDDDIQSMSASFSYNMLLSFFPFLIIVISILSFLPISAQEVLSVVSGLVPRKGYEIIAKFLSEITKKSRYDLLSISMFVTVFTASSGCIALIRDMNKVHGVEEKRPFWKVVLIAVSFTTAMFLMLLINVVMIILGDIIMNYVEKFVPIGVVSGLLVNGFRFLISMGIIFLVSIGGYFFLPSYHNKLKNLIPGSIFCAVSVVIISKLFSIYVNNFSNYTLTYGGLAGIIIALIWLNLIGMILFIGAEINMLLNSDKKK